MSRELFIMVTKTPFVRGAATIQVTFSLSATLWADTIALVGHFDTEAPTAIVLQRNETGWSTTLDLPTRQTYQYHFLLDGKHWMTDCHSDGFAMDAHGRQVSIVTT